MAESQYVEGTNGVLEKVVTAAPSILLPLLSARTTVKTMRGEDVTPGTGQRTHADDLRRWSAKEDLAAECATRHGDPAVRDRIDNLVHDTVRWSVLDPADTPLDGYAPAPAPHLLNKAQRQQATANNIDQQFAPEKICSLMDVLDAQGTPWLPSARVALETLWVSEATGDEHSIEYFDFRAHILQLDVDG